MKKFLCLLSLCFMTVGFVGCGEAEETPETPAPAAGADADEGAGGSDTKPEGE
ncbi:MAG: hypothetical protein ABJZ55_20750 [Fuerstiella sp.]